MNTVIIIFLTIAIILMSCIIYMLNTLYKKKTFLIDEIESLAKTGHWELNILKDDLVWSKEIFNIFEIDENKFKASYDAFLDFVHPEDREYVDNEYKSSLKNKSKYDIIHRLLLPGNKIKYVKDRCINIYDSAGNPLKSIGTVQDITDLTLAQKEKEKAEKQLRQSQKLEALGNLASGIAHDFNNILTPINVFTEIVMEDIDSTTENYKNLGNVLNAAQRAKDLVNQILSFSRQKEEKLIPVLIDVIVKEVIKLLKSSIPSNIEIVPSIAEDIPPVLADPTQIHQILMNLCTNSYHAIGHKNGIINISLNETYLSTQDLHIFPELKEGFYLNLVITDNGEGIEKKNLDRIFEPYFTTKPEGKGTGLGLSVVHGIIKNYGGAIKVYSDENKGTCFSIFIPAVKPEEKRDSDLASIHIPEGTETVIVVDDEELITESIQLILEKLGYRVFAFNDPINAYEYITLKYNEIDLIISDLTMPYMTGIQLSALIMEHGINIPVIISTGFSENLSTHEIIKNNISGTLLKPVLKNEIATTIRNVLDNNNE